MFLKMCNHPLKYTTNLTAHHALRAPLTLPDALILFDYITAIPSTMPDEARIESSFDHTNKMELKTSVNDILGTHVMYDPRFRSSDSRFVEVSLNLPKRKRFLVIAKKSTTHLRMLPRLKTF